MSTNRKLFFSLALVLVVGVFQIIFSLIVLVAGISARWFPLIILLGVLFNMALIVYTTVTSLNKARPVV